MSTITESTSRTLDQEPDAIAIIPQYPNYITVGTYHLNKPDHDEQDHDKSSLPLRGGSIQILPFSTISELPKSSSPIARKDFDCAIVDIHFHPDLTSLLGAATSAGELRFFWINGNDASTSGGLAFDILEVGKVILSEVDVTDNLPLVTYFTWMPGIVTGSHGGISSTTMVTLVACDTMGNTKLIRVRIPAPNTSLHLSQTDERSAELSSDIQDIHKQQFDLEAWFVTHVPLKPSAEQTTNLMLSGGDDGCILGTTCAIPTDGQPCIITKQFTIRKIHEAGVVSILPLNELKSDCRPILTGSYDDHLRLFLLSASSLPKAPDMITSINLHGGVWRIILLDNYIGQSDDVNWTFLVCAMYSGAQIVRLTAQPTTTASIRDEIGETSAQEAEQGTSDTKEGMEAERTEADTREEKSKGEEKKVSESARGAGYKWTFTIEAIFQGHASMVYAAVARTERTGHWTIVTSSFYDRQLCEWTWMDEKRSIGYVRTEIA